MPEPHPPAPPDPTAHTGAHQPVIPVPGEAILSDGSEPSDDQPTIISRKSPSRVGPAGEPLNGSVRGRTLAHFELIEPIGVGGMAAVIRARDRQLDRTVALKILPPEMASDPENIARFHQEARAAARLDHENIARVFYCGEDQRLHFIAFEFVEGLNLRALLERRGRLPVVEAVHYMLQIATGLAHAAGRGVVHRDIKPSNIIISPNGRAKLVDMGLARSMLPQDDRALTQSGVTLGTFDYISPEQALEPRQADVRSDIYSLGCTFYHMLTGQPPVPEGTAAKKLHYHQHIAPVDPRALNPQVPDEVAAILQRMMAKDPSDRYQRAEHLVQHLIQVAQQLGAPAEANEALLFVDAPLPTPPRRQPLGMAAAGALALGLFLIVLSVAPPGGSNGGPPVKAAEVKAPPRDRVDVAPAKGDGEPDRGAATVRNEEQLRAALMAKDPPAVLTLAERIELSAPLVLRGELEIRSAVPGQLVTLAVTPDRTAPDEREGWGGIVVDGAKVTFRDVALEMNASVTPRTSVSGVLVRRSGAATFERCTFSQPHVSLSAPLLSQRDLVPVASVATWNDPGPDRKPRLVFRACWFRRGQAAVSLRGGAEVDQISCAFSPHLTLFHLRDQDARHATHLDLKYVSAHLGHGPAFRLDGTGTFEAHVTASIFSGPSHEAEEAAEPADLIRQTDTIKTRGVRFTGVGNVYHNLRALYARTAGKEPPALEGWDVFRSGLADAQVLNERSFYLTAAAPWRHPAAAPAREPQRAFQVNPDLAALRRVEDRSRAIGVAECVWGQTNPALPPVEAPRPPEAVAKLKPHEKVVDPRGEGGAGHYATLAAALAEARSGDVLLIRHDGPLAVSPVELKGDVQVTVRPYPDYRPVLSLSEKTAAPDAALFTLAQGEVTFEGLEFHLRPERENFRSQSVVRLAGGKCAFKGCLVTLEAADGLHIPLSVAALAEPRELMKPMMMPDPGSAPVVALQQCFVRGDGELVAARGGRPFDLKLTGCLVALSGSLLYLEGSSSEMMPPGSVKLTLTRTTAHLGEHLVYLRAGKGGKGLAFTQITANNCLLAAAGGRSLVYLDGPDGEEQLKRVFSWVGAGNVYSGYDKLLEQQAAGEVTPTVRYGQEGWQRAWNEGPPEPRFVRMKFDGAADRPASQALPEEFRGKAEPETDLQGVGAAVEQMPRPASERVRPASDTTPPGGRDEELWHHEGPLLPPNPIIPAGE